jgi:hypothetical protein
MTTETSVPYEPISQLPSTGGVISINLLEGFLQIKEKFHEEHPEGIDLYVANLFGISVEELGKRLSAEQVDSVGVAWSGFEQRPSRSTVIADETGFGKGRIMASLALMAQKQGFPVVFITEKPNLFQDFFRDLVAVSGGQEIETIIPTVTHAKGKIVSQENFTKSGKPIVIAKPVSDSKLNKDDHPIVCTTYSQLRDEDRINAISEYMGRNALLLLDEAHQSMGQSKIGEAIQYLVKHSMLIAYASATYAWLGSHLKPLAPVLNFISPAFIPLLVKAVDMDMDGSLRSSLAEQMSLSGTLLRREHPPAPPSRFVILPKTEFQSHAMKAWMDLANFHLFLCENHLHRKDLWKTFGKWIPKTLRQMGVWLKMEGVADEIQKTLEENKKAVIVVDSTLSESEELADETEDGVLTGFWRETLKPVAEIEKSLSESDRAVWKDLISKLPEWHGSPLDQIVAILNKRNIFKIGEISGRIDPVKRKGLIAEFNSGELDVMFITRAGSTGISLHAGKLFKDQRIRRMIGWDAPNQSAVGKQFKGRVRRRDQVVEPEYVEIVLDTPYERKRADREYKKLELLNAQASGREVIYNNIPIESDEGQFIFMGWMKNNRDLAYKLGLFGADQHQAGLGSIHKALLRLPLIGLEESQEVFAHIENFLDDVKRSLESWYKKDYVLSEPLGNKSYYAVGTKYEVSIGKYNIQRNPLNKETIESLKEQAIKYQQEHPNNFHTTWHAGQFVSMKHPDTGRDQLAMLLALKDHEMDETAFGDVLFASDDDVRNVPYALVHRSLKYQQTTFEEFLDKYKVENNPIFALDGPLWLIHSLGEWLESGRMIFDKTSRTHKWMVPYKNINLMMKKPWMPLINPSHIAYWLDKGATVSTPDKDDLPLIRAFRMEDGIHIRMSSKTMKKILNKNSGFFGYVMKYKFGDQAKNAIAFYSSDINCKHEDKSPDLVLRYRSDEFAKGLFDAYPWGLSINVEEGEKYESSPQWNKFNESLAKVLGNT